MENTPENWYRNLPPVTRTVLTSVFATTCLVQMGLLNPYFLILDWKLVGNSYHIWRPLTAAMFFGKFSFQFVMGLYFLSNFGGKLERSDRFVAAPADYVFFLLFVTLACACLSVILSWPSGSPLLGPSVVFSILYYWSRCEPEARLSLYGFEVRGFQFPFAMMALTILLGGDVWSDLLGLGAGHIYYFLKDVVPLEYGSRVLRTPAVFARLLKPARAEDAPAPRVFGGSGRRLGRD